MIFFSIIDCYNITHHLLSIQQEDFFCEFFFFLKIIQARNLIYLYVRRCFLKNFFKKFFYYKCVFVWSHHFTCLSWQKRFISFLFFVVIIWLLWICDGYVRNSFAIFPFYVKDLMDLKCHLYMHVKSFVKKMAWHTVEKLYHDHHIFVFPSRRVCIENF